MPGVSPDSDAETFIALRCRIDNWRWAGVPFYLRTGKKLAEGQRIVSIAFHEPPKSMFPEGSGVGSHGPDHLTFDLADSAKMSLSFYGKRPGPGMQLDKLSLQFAMHDTGLQGDVFEAYERLILDAMRGDRTLFTTAEGIERLWEISEPLIDDPPPVRPYAPASWGPNAIHQLIAPHTWRLPFERAWRTRTPWEASVAAWHAPQMHRRGRLPMRRLLVRGLAATAMAASLAGGLGGQAPAGAAPVGASVIASPASEAAQANSDARALRRDVSSTLQRYLDDYADRFSETERAQLLRYKAVADRQLVAVVVTTKRLSQAMSTRSSAAERKIAASSATTAWKRAKAAADSSWTSARQIMEPRLSLFEKLGALRDYDSMMSRFDDLGGRIKAASGVG